ncbi:MAG TPA: TRAFs-binding domain-containing protein [Longimicrobium sp.]|nr:TRAFs-binding domain-containing protein [Longimicrobium sp.]
MKELCFVLMPFGRKPDAAGKSIDFDAVYQQLIAPAITAAGMQPLRADEEMTGGIIHKPMFERLVLCSFAVADLTTANPNVFYELGVRHAARPWSTVLLFAEGGRLPFDAAPLRAMPYRLSPDGVPVDVEAVRDAIAARLQESRKNAGVDSPLFQLVEGYPDQIAHEKTDVFREQVEYSAQLKEKLRAARAQGVEGLRAAEAELGDDLRAVESGVVIDLFLSYRAVSAWGEMERLVGRMPRVLAATIMVQEQLAFALNRQGRGEEAERVLLDLLESRGASSETYGLLGRVYKDRWETAASKDPLVAPVLLDRAIDAYLKGFQTDWRDAYPGVNALTLMTLRDPPDPRRLDLLPVVRYAVEQKIARGTGDYWDYATLLEIAAINGDQPRGSQALAHAAALLQEPWQAETTARNLRLIRESRERRGEPAAWVATVEQALLSRAAPASAPPVAQMAVPA